MTAPLPEGQFRRTDPLPPTRRALGFRLVPLTNGRYGTFCKSPSTLKSSWLNHLVRTKVSATDLRVSGDDIFIPAYVYNPLTPHVSLARKAMET